MKYLQCSLEPTADWYFRHLEVGLGGGWRSQLSGCVQTVRKLEDQMREGKLGVATSRVHRISGIPNQTFRFAVSGAKPTLDFHFLEVVVGSFVKMDKGTFNQNDLLLVTIVGAYDLWIEIRTSYLSFTSYLLFKLCELRRYIDCAWGQCVVFVSNTRDY